MNTLGKMLTHLTSNLSNISYLLDTLTDVDQNKAKTSGHNILWKTYTLGKKPKSKINKWEWCSD